MVVINTMTKQRGEEKVYLSLQFSITVHHLGKSGQELQEGSNLEIGTNAEAIEESYSCLALHGSLSHEAPRTTAPEMPLPTVDWALPHQSLTKKIPSGLAQG